MSNYTYLAHHGVKGMRWGVRRTYKLSGKVRKRYFDYTKETKRGKVKKKKTRISVGADDDLMKMGIVDEAGEVRNKKAAQKAKSFVDAVRYANASSWFAIGDGYGTTIYYYDYRLARNAINNVRNLYYRRSGKSEPDQLKKRKDVKKYNRGGGVFWIAGKRPPRKEKG